MLSLETMERGKVYHDVPDEIIKNLSDISFMEVYNDMFMSYTYKTRQYGSFTWYPLNGVDRTNTLIKNKK